MSATGGRIERIDALRGVAALCVCVQHVVQPIIANPATAPTTRALLSALTLDHFDLGRYGVVLFFLISGYVIPFSLRGDHALRRFAITRLLRLYPAFWLSVAAVAAVAPALPSAARLASNLTMAPTLFGQAYVSGVYWTLFVELAFYAICAVLFMAGGLRRPRVVFAVGLACAALPLIGVLARYVAVTMPIVYLGAHLSFLFAGTLLRLANEDQSPHAGRYAAVLTLVALAAMPALAAQPDHSFTRSTPLGVSFAGVAAVLTFAALHRRPGVVSPRLVHLGALSYAIYLFHTPVTRLAERIAPPAGAAAAITFVAVTLLATLALAEVVHAWIEHPMIALGKRSWPRRDLAIAVAP